MLIFTLSFFNVSLHVLLQMPEVTTKFILRSTSFTLLLLNFYSYQTKTITGVDLTSVNYNLLTYNKASIYSHWAFGRAQIQRVGRQSVPILYYYRPTILKLLDSLKLNVLLIYMYIIEKYKLQTTTHRYTEKVVVVG